MDYTDNHLAEALEQVLEALDLCSRDKVITSVGPVEATAIIAEVRRLNDQVAALRNHIEALHDIHQQRIEKHEAEIARLEDIIAQMAAELVDAWEAGEEEDDTRYQTLTIVQPPGRQYLATLNGCRVYLNGKELRVSNIEIRAGDNRFTTAVITMPVHLEWRDE